MDEKIKKAIEILNQGGIVIYPTDTAFGIGCRIDKEDSIEKLFQIRRRPKTQATPVLVDSLEMADKYWTEIPENIKNILISKYWPGALTIILPCLIDKVPSLVRGSGDNIGLRMPNHKIALDLIKGIKVPLLGPSANFHGDKTPYSFKDLDKELIRLVDFIIPGECSVKQASTVIDCSVTPWEIVRDGAVKLEL